MRRIITLTAPFIVLLIAWAMASTAELSGDAVKSLLMIIPYVIAFLALFMSVWYQNSNSFYLVCFILLSYILLNIAAAKLPMLIEASSYIGVLLPLNAVWLGFARERGVISTYGMNKAIIVLAEIIWVFIGMMGKSSLKTAAGMPAPAVLNVKAPAVVLFVIAICILLASCILKNLYMNLIFVSVLLASYVSLHFAHRPVILAIFTTAAFVNIVMALFDVSYSLAFYDTLTGVLSRRAMEQELLKLGGKYGVAMVDIDHFKKINDTYGHDVGDEVLKMVASILNRVSGRSKVFRYGGEEFAILFPGMSCNEIVTHMERARKAIERRPFIIRSENRPPKKPENIKKGASKGQGAIRVTVSVGVAQKNDLLKTCYDVVRKADEALYKSKNGGRNCVTKI